MWAGGTANSSQRAGLSGAVLRRTTEGDCLVEDRGAEVSDLRSCGLHSGCSSRVERAHSARNSRVVYGQTGER